MCQVHKQLFYHLVYHSWDKNFINLTVSNKTEKLEPVTFFIPLWPPVTPYNPF